jgi:hypothetical protein
MTKEIILKENAMYALLLSSGKINTEVEIDINARLQRLLMFLAQNDLD